MSSVNNPTISSSQSEIKATSPTNYLPWMALIIGIIGSVGAGIGVGYGVSLTMGYIVGGSAGFVVSLVAAIYLWKSKSAANSKTINISSIPNVPSNSTSVVPATTGSSSNGVSSMPIASNVSKGESQVELTPELIKYENENNHHKLSREAVNQVRSIHSWMLTGKLNLWISSVEHKGEAPSTYIMFHFEHNAFSNREIDPGYASSCVDAIGRIYCNIRGFALTGSNDNGLLIGSDWNLNDLLKMMGFRRKPSDFEALESNLTFSHTAPPSSASSAFSSAKKDPATNGSNVGASLPIAPTPIVPPSSSVSTSSSTKKDPVTNGSDAVVSLPIAPTPIVPPSSSVSTSSSTKKDLVTNGSDAVVSLPIAPTPVVSIPYSTVVLPPTFNNISIHSDDIKNMKLIFGRMDDRTLTLEIAPETRIDNGCEIYRAGDFIFKFDSSIRKEVYDAMLSISGVYQNISRSYTSGSIQQGVGQSFYFRKGPSWNFEHFLSAMGWKRNAQDPNKLERTQHLQNMTSLSGAIPYTSDVSKSSIGSIPSATSSAVTTSSMVSSSSAKKDSGPVTNGSKVVAPLLSNAPAPLPVPTTPDSAVLLPPTLRKLHVDQDINDIKLIYECMRANTLNLTIATETRKDPNDGSVMYVAGDIVFRFSSSVNRRGAYDAMNSITRVYQCISNSRMSGSTSSTGEQGISFRFTKALDWNLEDFLSTMGWRRESENPNQLELNY